MRLSAILAAALAAAPLAAAQQSTPAAVPPEAPAEVTLHDLLWVARPLVIFADSPADPRFTRQLAMLKERMDELQDRAVVVLTDTDPAAEGPLREELRPRGFGLVLIDRDGMVAQRRPEPTTARELINLIDRMPSRREESGSRRP
jgi:F420-dependent methylenetetrahydromethanopterin dehydrogenase